MLKKVCKTNCGKRVKLYELLKISWVMNVIVWNFNFVYSGWNRRWNEGEWHCKEISPFKNHFICSSILNQTLTSKGQEYACLVYEGGPCFVRNLLVRNCNIKIMCKRPKLFCACISCNVSFKNNCSGNLSLIFFSQRLHN